MLRPLACVAVLSLVGCGRSFLLELETDIGSEGDGTSPGGTRPPATTQVTTTTTTDGPPDEGEAEAEVDSGPDIPPPPARDLGPGCAELGTACMGPDDCCSGQCFQLVTPLGGVCSECDDDDDCRWGCDQGYPLDLLPAICGDGLLGSGCTEPTSCQDGLVCTPMILGLLETSTCGACLDDTDCPPDLHCAVLYTSFATGFRECVPPDSRPLYAGCLNDAVCMSGACAVVSFSGSPMLTLCAPCNDDADCPGGSCSLPELEVGPMGFEIIEGSCE